MLHSTRYISCLIVTFLVISIFRLNGQDNERPISPQLTLVSVDPGTGFSHLFWTPGGSPDVAGYVIYLFNDGLGEAVDTIYNSAAIDYVYTKTTANSYSVDYVVAAIDSSDNTSPLSNPLSTIYLTTILDTCNHQLILHWNLYNDYPSAVTDYSVFVSMNSGAEQNIGTVLNSTSEFIYGGFETGNTYCFRITANIEGGSASSSNSSCMETEITRPPLWINGDYSSIDENNNIEVSFTYDTDSEIELFRLEKAYQEGGPFTMIKEISNSTGNIVEESGIIESQPQYFRLSAVNNCGLSAIYSNIITALPLSLIIDEDDIIIRWWEYRSYSGDISDYNIFRLMNGEKVYLTSTAEGDTIYSDNLAGFIYQNNSDQICYQVEVVENNNPYVPGNTSLSQISCIDTPAKIYVPNVFTPDGDLLNDTFYPVLTFTPTRYRLFIKTLSGKTVFSTNDYMDKWDGTLGGLALEPGVYLWFLELSTPGGKEISKNGSVTILFN
jgi:hypothetical protein